MKDWFLFYLELNDGVPDLKVSPPSQDPSVPPLDPADPAEHVGMERLLQLDTLTLSQEHLGAANMEVKYG